MRNVYGGNLKDLGIGQKCLFEYADCSEAKNEGTGAHGMPAWFWELARECKEETSG